jgi:LacI family transcriptional regulator
LISPKKTIKKPSMTHRFPIKEIARQSGLGPATVDRVLNDRANVSPQTRNRVRVAMDELARQEQQLTARGRRLFVDVVVEAPQRFANVVRDAAESVLPSIGIGVFRPRFQMYDLMGDAEMASCLHSIARRGSQGVCLKARDVPSVRDAIDRLVGKGIPVITLVTDVRDCRRHAYAGLDNAGNTRRGTKGTVITTRSQEAFSGEAERFHSFRETLARLCPDLHVIDVSGSGGLSRTMPEHLDSAVSQTSQLAGVYSMGGANAATLEVLRQNGIENLPYIAHDLDAENRALLADGKLSFVLHHDLTSDFRQIFMAIAGLHGLGPRPEERLISDIQIVTPFNQPQSL